MLNLLPPLPSNNCLQKYLAELQNLKIETPNYGFSALYKCHKISAW